MSKMFDFDAHSFIDEFAEHGYVHIPQGLPENFHARLVKYVEDSFDKKHLKDFARGDKQQAMFEFLDPEHYDELRETVATICGVDVNVSEERFAGFHRESRIPRPREVMLMESGGDAGLMRHASGEGSGIAARPVP